MTRKNTDEGDRSRLPKWARDKIALLEMRLREADARLRAASEGHPTSEVGVVDYSTTEPRLHNLPRGSIVRFTLDPSDMQGYLEVHRVREKSMEEWIDVHGGDGIEVRPRSSNVIYVRIIPRGQR